MRDYKFPDWTRKDYFIFCNIGNDKEKMKTTIHPQWHHDTVVTCSCGNKFTTGATQTSLVVDICGACHPFYTGEMKFVDRQKRVDKFLKKMQVAQLRQQQPTKKTSKTSADSNEQPKSYQDILRDQQQVLKQQARKSA